MKREKNKKGITKKTFNAKARRSQGAEKRQERITSVVRLSCAGRNPVPLKKNKNAKARRSQGAEKREKRQINL